jgi:hypothetical protein
MKIHSLLAALATVATLYAQDPFASDPYVKNPPPAGAVPESKGPRNISVCYETFSVPLALAAKWQRAKKPDSGFYATLIESVGKDGVRQESFDMVRFPSGQKATVKCVTEEIYPSEYEQSFRPGAVGVAVPPSISAEMSGAPVDAEKAAPSAAGEGGLRTPCTPTSFETRDVGRAFEVEGTMGEGNSETYVDLRLVPEMVTFAGRQPWGQGISRTEMPVFETQRINTAITVRPNQPALLGTLSRPPGSQADQDSAKRIWFAFVTVRLVKP